MNACSPAPAAKVWLRSNTARRFAPIDGVSASFEALNESAFDAAPHSTSTPSALADGSDSKESIFVTAAPFKPKTGESLVRSVRALRFVGGVRSIIFPAHVIIKSDKLAT